MGTRTFNVLEEKHCYYCGKHLEPELKEPTCPNCNCVCHTTGKVHFAEYSCDCEEARAEAYFNAQIEEMQLHLEELADCGIGDQGRMLIQARATRDQADAEIKALEEAMQEGNA